MPLATRIRTTDTRTRGDLSRIGGESNPNFARIAIRDRTMRVGRKGLVLIAVVTCLVLVLSTYGSEAFAQGTAEESFVESVVSNVNAFWDKEFQQLGYPYSPADLVFVYDQPVDTRVVPSPRWTGPPTARMTGPYIIRFTGSTMDELWRTTGNLPWNGGLLTR